MRIEMGNIINALIVIIGSGVWYQMREIRQLFKDLKKDIEQTRHEITHHKHVVCENGASGVVVGD